MDWQLVITRNRAALASIVAGLAAMAGWGEGPAPGAVLLPRALRLAVLRLLRPAESAVRRLIIVAARGLIADAPAGPALVRRPARPTPVLMFFRGRMMSPARIAALAAAASRADPPARPPARAIAFPLTDPRKRIRLARTCAPTPCAPRILFPDRPFPHLPPTPEPDGLVDARRVALRLSALGAALDDLPGQARRLAKLRARPARGQGADAASRRPSRPPRRPGRPPGLRRTRPREIDAILADCDFFAREAERDTS